VQAENEHDILLIISAFGIFLYASYTIIAGRYFITSLSKQRKDSSILYVSHPIVEIVKIPLLYYSYIISAV
jgi:hypothetical protein